MPYLVVREPERVALSVSLDDRPVRVGRDRDNEVVVADRQASRHHVRIEPSPDGPTVIDCGSRHGTFLNGARLEASRRMLDGDVVQVGNVLISYHAGAASDDVSAYTAAALPVISGSAGRRLAALYAVSALTSVDLEASAVAEKLLDQAMAGLAAERGVVVLTQGVGLRLERPPGSSMVVARAIIDRLLARRESVLVASREVDQMATAASQGVRSALGAPLASDEQVWGYIYVDHLGGRELFTTEELAFLTALATLAAAALAMAERRRHQQVLAEALRESDPLPDLLGESPPVRELKEHVRRYARAGDAAVLILGESGTGKELIARTLHELSPRQGEPFVALNCAALPDTLVESELFGHEKGAFTGAGQARRGKFLLADKGTLFLDEIGDLSLSAQAKLLRVLQEGEVQVLGSEAVRTVDVRVVAATHRSLSDEIAAGRFREDLFYRLSVGEIRVPPLRVRGDDVILLAEAFLARAGRRMAKRGLRFSPAALTQLRGYGWPGNVRQLANEVERAVILSDGPIVEILLRTTTPAQAAPAPARSLTERFAQLDLDERALVEEALARAGGNASEAARLLGISRTMLRRRRERLSGPEED